MRRVPAVLISCLLATVPASAQALTLKAGRPETGWIRLTAADVGDATTVQIDERIGSGTQPVGDFTPQGGQAIVRHARDWLCNRRDRAFVATALYPDGSSQTAEAKFRTPSCRKRLSFRSHRAHNRISMHVTDRWHIGDVSSKTCITAPGHRTRCRVLRFSQGEKAATRVVSARAGGLWTASLRTSWGQSPSRTFYARPHGALRLLATGDSMIQIVDTYLKERLATRRVKVRSDARESTGLSKPFLLNWPAHAKKQARGIRPDVTVVAIGANDGFPFGGVDCCGGKWVDAYARRVRSMMSSYSRGGRSLVYWLTLPAPRPAQWKPIYPAVNRAIKRAAASFHGRVRVLDIARTFTPGYRFRQSMTWRGHRQNVRAPDGVHLSPSGASIAEALIERALRRDGAL
jgi:hypothetical protein